MKHQIAVIAVTAVLALTSVYTAQAQSGDAILDMLTKKGVITQKEANDVREQIDRNAAKSTEAYGKVKVSSWVDSLTWYGDGRLRYEYRGGQGNTGSGGYDNTDLNRFRYRLRFGFTGQMSDNFSYGFRLETSTKGNGANSTMGPGLSGGPWTKLGTDAIGVGQIWATYKPTDWLTLTGGKMENPFMTTKMVWDDDLNPEGFAQKLTYKAGNVDLFLTLGEFMYLANTANKFGSGSGASNDVWMIGAQVGGKWNINKGYSLTVAPTLYSYVNAYNSGLGGGGDFAPTMSGGNVNGIDHLTVFDVPVELAFLIGKIPAKLFGDFAVNLDGSQRAASAALTQDGSQNITYQVGLAVGSNKKKHDWLAKAYWQHQELFSLDPNLVDSDLFDGHLNMEGVVFSGQYMFTDFLSGVVTYAHASAIKDNLPTLYSSGDLTGNVRHYDLLQVDLVWKF